MERAVILFIPELSAQRLTAKRAAQIGKVNPEQIVSVNVVSDAEYPIELKDEAGKLIYSLYKHEGIDVYKAVIKSG